MNQLWTTSVLSDVTVKDRRRPKPVAFCHANQGPLECRTRGGVWKMLQHIRDERVKNHTTSFSRRTSPKHWFHFFQYLSELKGFPGFVFRLA